MSIKTSVPDKLPLTRLEWGALVPILGEANRALGRFEARIRMTPMAALKPLTLQEAKDTFRAQAQATPQEIRKCLQALRLIRQKKARPFP